MTTIIVYTSTQLVTNIDYDMYSCGIQFQAYSSLSYKNCSFRAYFISYSPVSMHCSQNSFVKEDDQYCSIVNITERLLEYMDALSIQKMFSISTKIGLYRYLSLTLFGSDDTSSRIQPAACKQNKVQLFPSVLFWQQCLRNFDT